MSGAGLPNRRMGAAGVSAVAPVRPGRSHPARRRAWREGARAIGPSAVAMAAWGLVTGLAMVQVGLTLLPALALVFAVYSGTSQLAVLPLLATGTGVAAMLLAAAVANLRFVVYSAVLSRHLRRLPLAPRLAIGYITIDGPVAALMERLRARRHAHRVSFLLAANLATAAVWCASSVLGMALAALVPRHLDLGFLGVLALLALVVPMVRGRENLVAAAVAIGVALAFADGPRGLVTLLAVLAAVAAALAVLRRPGARP